MSTSRPENGGPGDVVPREAAPMCHVPISRMTANRALRGLPAEGLVTRVQGSRTHVAQLHRISSQLVIRDIHEKVAERGRVPGTRFLEAAQSDSERDRNVEAGDVHTYPLLTHELVAAGACGMCAT